MTPLTMSINSPGSVPLVADCLGRLGLAAPVCVAEILWDNFAHLDPHDVRDMLAPIGRRCSLHIMWSQFLQAPESAFREFLDRLARHVAVLEPIVVSDHLCRFTLQGLKVPFAQEHGYDALERSIERVRRYQDAIGMPLHLENAASTHHAVRTQIEYLLALRRATGCEVMFDVSNAIIGELNGKGSASEWHPLLDGRRLHLHVGGFARHPESGTWQDTHAHAVDERTLEFLSETLARHDVGALVYERDYNTSVAGCMDDLTAIQGRIDHETFRRLPV